MESDKEDEGLPTESLREAFMRREYIQPLPADERERLWVEHRERLKPFLISIPAPSREKERRR
jgi:hypothetical protein